MTKEIFPIYFIQGSKIRLHAALNEHDKSWSEYRANNFNEILQTNTTKLEQRSKFILSGCSIMNKTPEETESEKLKHKLENTLKEKGRYKIPNQNIFLHEKGIERLGCFLQAREILDSIDPNESQIIMPIETLYLPSYTSLFEKINGHKVTPLEISHHSSLFQKASETWINYNIQKDEKDKKLKTKNEWRDYIEEIYGESNDNSSNSKYVNLCWTPYKKLKRI